MVYADLHVHTNYSDGTHSIEEVIRLAKNRGIKVVAITDHDTLYHYDKVKKICEKNNIKTIRGVEMSCYDFDVYKKVHVVGLWLNDNPTHVEELCNHTLKCRDEYHHQLIDELNDKGLDLKCIFFRQLSINIQNITIWKNIENYLQEKYLKMLIYKWDILM